MTGTHDAITASSGIGGLTATALYARVGHPVPVLEYNDEFGRAATTYRLGRRLDGDP